MNRGRVLAVGAFLSAFLAAGTAVLPAAPKAKRDKAPAKAPTLDGAVAELRREYVAYQKNVAAKPLREACDYFTENPQTVPAATVLSTLEKPHGNDNRLAAYVKWQLLGALPATLEEPDVQRLIRVYQKAPMPARRYASSRPEQQKLDKVLMRARLQDDVQVTDKLEKAVAAATEADHPIIAYRDELYRRLPPGRDKLIAGLRDGYDRMNVAAPLAGLMETVADDLQGWALSGDAPQAQVREVAELIGKLRFEESPPYYASAAVRGKRLGWIVKTDRLLPKTKMANLHKLLLEAAGMPAPADDDKAGGGAGNDGMKKNGKDKDKNKSGTDS